MSCHSVSWYSVRSCQNFVLLLAGNLYIIHYTYLYHELRLVMTIPKILLYFFSLSVSLIFKIPSIVLENCSPQFPNSPNKLRQNYLNFPQIPMILVLLYQPERRESSECRCRYLKIKCIAKKKLDFIRLVYGDVRSCFLGVCTICLCSFLHLIF